MDGCPEGSERSEAEGCAAERSAARPAGGPAGHAYQHRVERIDICGRCEAPRFCCHCAADVARLRRFATRMAMIHQPTGTSVCGCGTHACYIRTRLDDVAGPFGRPPRGPARDMPGSSMDAD